MPEAERDAYENLILLCLEHHKIVDDDPAFWTIDELRKMKRVHEARVDKAMTIDDRRSLARDVQYALILDEWVKQSRLDEWHLWTNSLLEPSPCIHAETAKDLYSLNAWLFARVWPGDFAELENALKNFSRVLTDLCMAIRNTLEPAGGDMLRRIPLYKKRIVDNYDELLAVNMWVVDVLHDLVFELTRAANLVANRTRAQVDPMFRFVDGLAVIDRGGPTLEIFRYAPIYSAAEITKGGYEGLRDFLVARTSRGDWCGDGIDEAGLFSITSAWGP
jgi:hypothetical protein